MSDIKSSEKLTAFQQKVYDALKLIPEGRVTTYKILGDFINCNSAQAIGQALKKNPFAPGIPCHRVIKSNFNIGGYVGEVKGAKIDQKKKLLESEGIAFDSSNILKDLTKIYNF
ncbi:MAG: MGMT family protein [Lentisphaeraceae bacterium]|nr:MGMT family protein [Lentisphaeraceae bacterium]